MNGLTQDPPSNAAGPMHGRSAAACAASPLRCAAGGVADLGNFGQRRIELAAPFSPVRLWRVALDDAAALAAPAWLSASEAQRAARFVFARDGQRYRAAHGMLRQLLWRHCGLAAGVEFHLGAQGKPSLGPSAAWQFNLSHSGAHGLIAISEGVAVGVDVEVVRPIDDLWLLAEQNFSHAELDALRQTPRGDQAHAFLTAWTRKEACLKAVGSGLSIAPASVDAGVQTHVRTITIEMPGGPAEVCVESVAAGDDMLAAVATVSRTPTSKAHLS